MLRSTYGPEIVDLLMSASFPIMYEKQTEITVPDGPYTVGILVSGWVLLQQSFGHNTGFSELILPFDPLVRLPSSRVHADWTWQTRTDVRVFWLNREHVSKLFLTHSEFRARATQKLLDFHAQTEERLRVATHYGASSRLAHFVIETLGRLKRSNAAIYDRFLCPLAQSELGSLLGMTNIHVSRSLSRLEDQNLIKRHKSFIEVVDAEKLKALYIPETATPEASGET